MAQVTMYKDIWCPECESDDIEITDYSDLTLFCICKDCGHRFNEPNM